VAFGPPVTREPGEVAREAGALAEEGARHFRVGGQTCILSYKARGVGSTETPEPDAKKVEALFSGIRRAAPDLAVLHADNANPAVMSVNPESSRDALEAIASHCTPGNTLALGLESADPAVREANNLNADARQTLEAITMMNEIGGERGANGLPRLLPGVNFVTGLRGETRSTLELNRAFLQELTEDNLLVRRVNVRRALLPDSPGPARSPIHAKLKKWVTDVFEPAMLARLLPEGTVLRDVFLERSRGNVTFGRQAGSYPVLVGVPYPVDLNRWVDVVVTSHGSRSVGGVEYPLDINTASMKALAALPGVGKKRAAAIVRRRPIKDEAHLAAALDSQAVANTLMGYVKLE
jgi:radical SAM superfamily enzyme with C-terminal helix-hairpin-helix motif